ncbi:hypothetical protein SAMN05216308_10549 [Nitrosospira sp. Nsp13]|nr:hypothetical protein SAMN05216308_10549 [Nitrosospira sp. Nsp13]
MRFWRIYFGQPDFDLLLILVQDGEGVSIGNANDCSEE